VPIGPAQAGHPQCRRPLPSPGAARYAAHRRSSRRRTATVAADRISSKDAGPAARA
jgi:hypothetical protein